MKTSNAKQVLTLPRWSMAERAAPNVLLRTLFKAMSSGDHGYVPAKQPELLLDTPTLRIRYSGPVLSQADLDVWQSWLDMASRAGSLTIRCSNAALLASLGRTDGGKQYQLLHEQIIKLVGAVPEVTASGKIEMDNLLTASFDDDTRLWEIRLNPYIAQLFKSFGYTRINLTERRALADSPLAQWLHIFFATHDDAAPYALTQLQRLSGRPVTNFTRDLKLAVAVLERELPTIKSTATADLPQSQRKGWCIELFNVGTARQPDYRLHMNKHGLTTKEVQVAKIERAEQKRARTAGKKTATESPAPLRIEPPAPVAASASWAELTKDGLAALAYRSIEELEALATQEELRKAKALVEYCVPRGGEYCDDLRVHLIGVMRVSRDPGFDDERWHVFQELSEI